MGVDFGEWWNSNWTEQELNNVIRRVAKRRNLFFALFLGCLVVGLGLFGALAELFPAASREVMAIGSIIAVVLGGIFCGCTVLVYKTLVMVRSRGRSEGSNGVKIALIIIGVIIIPLVTIVIVKRIPRLWHSICGV